jgi:hypothetical protein
MDTLYKLETKFLVIGLYISENMKRVAYEKSLSAKVSTFSYITQPLQEVLSPHLVQSVYFANVYTYLRYGFVFWGGDTEDKTIFKLQTGLHKYSVLQGYTHCSGNFLRIYICFH